MRSGCGSGAWSARTIRILAGELLKELGLSLDRRKELPRKVAEFVVPREKTVPTSSMAGVRRTLADALAQERTQAYSAAAGD